MVLTLAGEMRYVRHFYGAAKRLAVRYAVARADALVVCSADEMLNLAAVAPRAVSRAVLLDNFTDVARFAPAPHKEPLVAFALASIRRRGPCSTLTPSPRCGRRTPGPASP